MHLFSHGVLLTPGDSHQAICAAGNWCRTQNHWLAVISRKSPAHKVRWNEGVNLLEIEINVKWEKMWEILAQLHMHERLIQPLKSDLIWPLNAVPWSWLKHLRIINYFTTSPADWCGALGSTQLTVCVFLTLPAAFGRWRWRDTLLLGRLLAAQLRAVSAPRAGNAPTLQHIWGCFFSLPRLTKLPPHEDEAIWSLRVPQILCNISIQPLQAEAGDLFQIRK